MFETYVSVTAACEFNRNEIESSYRTYFRTENRRNKNMWPMQRRTGLYNNMSASFCVK